MAKELLSYANKHMHAWLHSLTQTQTHTHINTCTQSSFSSQCVWAVMRTLAVRCLASDHLNGGPHQQHSNNLFGRRRECIIKRISSHSNRKWCDLSNIANDEQLWFAWLSLSYMVWHANILAVSQFHTTVIAHVLTRLWVWGAFSVKKWNNLECARISMQSKLAWVLSVVLTETDGTIM